MSTEGSGESAKNPLHDASPNELARGFATLLWQVAKLLLVAAVLAAAVGGVVAGILVLNGTLLLRADLASLYPCPPAEPKQARIAKVATERASAPLPSVAPNAAPSPSAGIALDAIPDARAALIFAHFVGENLAECIEIEAVGSAEKTEELGKLDPGAKDAKILKLSKPCTESFADRVELAGCTFEKTKDGATVKMRSHIYAFDVAFQTDANMRECLEMKGEWKAISRTSAEYNRAKLEADSARLRGMLR